MRYILILFLSFFSTALMAGDKDFPDKPSPPRLVNDFAHMMSGSEVEELEAKLLEYEKSSSTQITVVTIKNLGGYEISQYAVELGNKWGVGHKGKNNGVVLLASMEDRKVNISTGYGLEGALTDIMCGRIIRNEIVPEFKAGNYYGGFTKGADAIIKATKGEYTAEEVYELDEDVKDLLLGLFILIIAIIARFISKRRGGGGGSYMSGRGADDLGRGMFWGTFLGGGHSGGGSSSGGGFGGFGGGSFGGGGSSGSW